jgi:DNA-directed RNA polymerase specialized sigma24 family protein
MSCPEKPKIADFRADYANRADFCQVLQWELRPLYLLSFLLTANHKKAEQCFATTVDEALKEQPVFKDWVRSWIKRSLIKNAIGAVSPASAGNNEERDLWSGQHETGGDDQINAVTQLPPLQRFVFVMSILERYSAWDCSVLLGCSMSNVAESRKQALRRLPGPVGHLPRVEARALSFVESLA